MGVCLYQKSVFKEYQTRLQSSATGFLMPDQRHFLSLIPIIPCTDIILYQIKHAADQNKIQESQF